MRWWSRIWLIAAVLLPCVAGCATFGRRGASAERTATCRELSRQAAAAIEAGQPATAEPLLRKAIAASPDDSEAHRQLAEALWMRGAVEEAREHMEIALRERPEDAALLVRSGEMLLQSGDREAALIQAEQAIRLEPHLASAWALRGRVYWHLNQPDRALADMTRSLEFSPASNDVLWDVAVLYRQRSQSARCLATLHQLHDLCRTGEEPQAMLVLEGQTLLDLGRPQQAADCLLAATGRGKPTADLLCTLAQAQLAAGRQAEATAAAQQALAIDSSHQGSRQLLTHLASLAAPGQPQRR